MLRVRWLLMLWVLWVLLMLGLVLWVMLWSARRLAGEAWHTSEWAMGVLCMDESACRMRVRVVMRMRLWLLLRLELWLRWLQWLRWQMRRLSQRRWLRCRLRRFVIVGGSLGSCRPKGTSSWWERLP